MGSGLCEYALGAPPGGASKPTTEVANTELNKKMI